MRAVAREQPLSAPERAAAFLRALATGHLIRARSLAMVVAHPDDEAIGAGAQLPRLNGLTMVHVTDGASRKPHDAERHGFATAAEYAFARARELERVMMLAGIPVADRFCLGLPDQEAALHLPRVARALVRLFMERATEIVLTHSYEGGHPDHDAAAFAVHAAVALLRREGLDIAIIEMPFYRADGDGWAVQRFAPAPAAGETVLAPGDRDRAMKRQMLAAHRTQAEMLALFDAETERFRIAPANDFSALPNGGHLHYERHDWGMTGARWLHLVEAASRELGLEPTS
jgi:LmbE family N-acetylglucosaminyl deacetylase